MIYVYDFTVPHTTTPESPERMVIHLPGGRIRTVHIGFSLESAATTAIRIYHMEWQIFPANPGSWFSWAGVLFEWGANYILDQPENRMQLVGYSDSINQDHTIKFIFDIDRGEERVTDLLQALAPPQPVSDD